MVVSITVSTTKILLIFSVCDTDVYCVACSACVSLGERNRFMGASAQNQLVSNVKNTIWGWKKLIGHKFSELVVQNEIPHFTYEVVEGRDSRIGIQVFVQLCMML